MATPAAECRIELCGEFRVQWQRRRLEAGLPGRQSRLLFAYSPCRKSGYQRLIEVLEAKGDVPEVLGRRFGALMEAVI